MLVSALAHGAARAAANDGVPLTCWQARQELSEYLDDDLEAQECAALEAHLAGCATCPPRYQALVGITASMDALHDPGSVVPSALADHTGRTLASGSTGWCRPADRLMLPTAAAGCVQWATTKVCSMARDGTMEPRRSRSPAITAPPAMITAAQVKTTW